jgi:hypothetical protein
MWSAPKIADSAVRSPVVVKLLSGREFYTELVRGPLWPTDGGYPPSYAEEIEDGIFENCDGRFGSMSELANFYGCLVDNDKTEYIESN